MVSLITTFKILLAREDQVEQQMFSSLLPQCLEQCPSHDKFLRWLSNEWVNEPVNEWYLNKAYFCSFMPWKLFMDGTWQPVPGEIPREYFILHLKKFIVLYLLNIRYTPTFRSLKKYEPDRMSHPNLCHNVLCPGKLTSAYHEASQGSRPLKSLSAWILYQDCKILQWQYNATVGNSFRRQ